VTRRGRVTARRGLAPPAVTWRRVRSRPTRALLVGIGVAVAVAFLVAIAGANVLSEELSLRHALDSLPPSERVVRVDWSGSVASGGYAALDRTARRALASLTAEPVSDSVELTDVRLGYGLVKLGAADRLGRTVQLRSGRLPRSCDAARCEVVQVGGTAIRRIDDAGVHLVVVGRGTLATLVTFGQEGLSTVSTAGGERPEPVLLTSGAAALARLAPLASINRSYSWSARLAPGSIHAWGVDTLFAKEARAEESLASADPQFVLTTPDDALSTASSESETASRRVLLVGSSAAMLLLAFAGITAGALRRDARAELRRLVARGATATQQRAFVLGEAIAAVLPGALGGLVLGSFADLVIARRARVPASDAVVHGLATPTTITLAAAGSVGAVLAVILALREIDTTARRGVRPIDMAALGSLTALILLLVTGRNGNGGLDAGPAIALAATPLLAAFSFCVLLGRLLDPFVRLALRAARGGPLGLFVALLTLQRSPGRTAGIVGFLAVATGLAVFTFSYRATLSRSDAERAAYAVPLDYTLQAGPALVAPGQLGTTAVYRSLAPGVGAWPILRQAADVPGTGSTPATPAVLGVPSDAFGFLHDWRSDFGASDPATIGRLLRPNGAVALRGPLIPAAATRLELPARDHGAVVQPVLDVLTRDGDADQLLPPLATAKQRVLTVAVPPADRGGRIVALALDLPSAVQRSTAHQEAEGQTPSSTFAGTLQLGALVARTQDGPVRVSSFDGWVGRGGISRLAGRGALRLHFALDTSETAMIRPRQPFDSRLLPVAASPDVAAGAGPGGRLELNFGGQIVRARLVARLNRFPTTQDAGDSFVVADEASLASALGADDLASSIPDELWLSTPPAVAGRVGTLLRRLPYSLLAVSSRRSLEAGFRDDPLSRGIVVSLLAAAVSGLALALVGLALVTVGFLRDEGDTLFDLESQGVGPRTLRASVRWRALGLAGVGLSAGVLLGSLMVDVTGRLLALDSTLTLPDPPLRRVTPWLRIGISALVLVLAASFLVELAVRLAQRRSAAGRGTTGESWAG
jgi:hypothetical protein